LLETLLGCKRTLHIHTHTSLSHRPMISHTPDTPHTHISTSLHTHTSPLHSTHPHLHSPPHTHTHISTSLYIHTHIHNRDIYTYAPTHKIKTLHTNYRILLKR